MVRPFFLVFGWIAVQAIFSILSLNLELTIGGASISTIAISIALTVTIFGLIRRYWRLITYVAQRMIQGLGIIPKEYWIPVCICIGILLRLTWVTIFPAPLRSDYATYFRLGQNLAEHGTYQTGNSGYAYWPPGYPFFLFINFLLLGVHSWVPTFANILLFGATTILAYRIANLISGESVARFTTLIFTFWPTSIASTGLASKERLVVFLLSLSILLFLLASKPISGQDKPLFRFFVGIALGLGSLSQPSILLFPCVLLIYHLLCTESDIRYLLKFTAPILAGMLLTIAPWTFRNYIVMNQWVPISTNGGDVFYRANNPLATGGYTVSGFQKLDESDEVQRNRQGFRLGIQWILANPSKFGGLMFRKQILFLGDDSQGVFETLKRALEINDLRYFFTKGISNLYWLGIWVLVLVAVIRAVEEGQRYRKETVLLMLSFLYFVVIHSIFESGGRHHEPMAVGLAILAALALSEEDLKAGNA